jgi:hypothetical protein
MKTRRDAICAFAGPSLCGLDVPVGVRLFPPATRGALADAVRDGYTRLGFIDGAVDGGQQVPLREIRDVLGRPDVQVYGAASFGAIRAVQLAGCGMRGIGRVYRLFRRGSLADSDEVFALHAPAGLRYRCLTLPLVNIRYTLRAMRRRGHVTRADEHSIVQYLHDVPWFDRDRRSVCAAVYAVCGSGRSKRIMHAFDSLFHDVKRADAAALLSVLVNEASPQSRSTCRASMGIR